MNFRIVMVLLFVSAAVLLPGQTTPGCTDPQANNYDPMANWNDGSCTYNPTIFSPPFKYLLPEAVEETSGLIYWDGNLWTINDSGNPNVLYRLDTLTGAVLQQITISDAQNIDWEALAQDDDHIYIGDFGNNAGTRSDLGIYVVQKSQIPDEGNGSVTSSLITYTYEDYSILKAVGEMNNFDCEALISIEDSLYLFSKNWGDEQTKLYRLPKTPGNYTAEKIATFNTSGLVTGADYNEESKEITLIGYTNNSWVPFFWLLFDYHDNRVFSGNKRRIDLLNIVATQTEAISYMEGKQGDFTSEGSPIFTQSAFDFSTAAWTDTLATSVQLPDTKAFDFVLSPNPVSSEKILLTVQSLPPGNYLVEVFDTSGQLIQIVNYQVHTLKGSVKIDLDISHLKNGLYFVRMRSGNHTFEEKFVVSK